MSKCDENLPENTEAMIGELMSEPQSAAGDQGSFTNRSLADVIAADQYLAGKKRTRSQKIRGIYAARLLPPSARG